MILYTESDFPQEMMIYSRAYFCTRAVEYLKIGLSKIFYRTRKLVIFFCKCVSGLMCTFLRKSKFHQISSIFMNVYEYFRWGTHRTQSTSFEEDTEEHLSPHGV